MSPSLPTFRANGHGRLRHLAWVLSVVLLCCPHALAQSSRELGALRKRIESLEAGQRQIQEDLQILKNLLMEKQPAVEQLPLDNVVISTAGAASLGSVNAKVTIVEFSDYQCPFCGRYANDTYPRLITDYVNTGKVRYVVRNFPLDEIHPFAVKAAEAAECAGDQGRYWEFHARLFRNQQALDSQNLLGHAASLGLDESKFRGCMEQGKFNAKVKADVSDGRKLGVNGTPSFFFGYSDEKDPTKVKVVKVITGSQPLNAFIETLEYLLDPPPDGGKNQ